MKTAKEIFAANQILTIEIAKKLIGKRIQTAYFGYNEQDGVDDFVVGEIKRESLHNGEKGEICLFTSDGRNTGIKAYEFNNGEFTCSDSDRFVSYVQVDEN